MSVVKRTRDGIDILEHAMQGVHTSDNHGQIVSFYEDPRDVVTDSAPDVRAFDDTRVEWEVIVRMPALPRRRSR
jgi:hypothetical protein